MYEILEINEKINYLMEYVKDLDKAMNGPLAIKHTFASMIIIAEDLIERLKKEKIDITSRGV